MATAPRSSRSVLSLQGVALAERHLSAAAVHLDLDLPHGEVALVQVEIKVHGGLSLIHI